MSKASHGLKKGQHLKLRIESIAAGGQGFTKYDGISIFVDRGVPGDLAELELYDVRKDFAHAKIANLIEPSKMRHEPPCKLFKVCGGCQWQHIQYEQQLNLKTDIVKQVIKHIAGLDDDIVQPIIGASDSLYYRNKVQFPVSSPKGSSRLLAGYYKEGSHELVNIKHCPVQPAELDLVLEACKIAAEHAGLSAYDEKSHTGLIRHFLGRYSFSQKQVLLTVVLNANTEAFQSLSGSLKRFADEIMEDLHAVVGVCVNFNTSRGNRILGQETKSVAGQDFIIEQLCSRHEQAPEVLQQGLRFQLSPASFFQVNSDQAVQLMDLVFDAVLDYKNSKGLDRLPLIVDAFAGVASIALWVAPLAERVLAIEEIQDAVNDAKKIMELNSINNVESICGRVEDVFPRLVADKSRPQIVILDPPRKGVDQAALKSVAQLEPDRIVYVSCNPATLARDLKILQESGYRTKLIRPLDLFPQTFHVESVSVLDRA